MSLISSPDSPADTATRREQAVLGALQFVRQIVCTAAEPSPAQLRRVGEVLAAVASRAELFPDAHFPAPAGSEIETLYLLGQSPDGSHALYVWRPAPGLATAVHDHSTWAVVAGIEGVEPNVIWRRLDDGSVPGRCALEPVSRARIGPGQHIGFGPHDIHSVAIEGTQAIKHLHLYGHSLMDLPERVDFDVETGTSRRVTEKPVVLLPVRAQTPQRDCVATAQ